ncbi:hypothetical protein ALQ51_04389 [Pseudomonas cannabina]|uniref:Uncharacterized protein n=1 Tax=Pseudomonas cannabina TaxID=86840 RepID=A0A3M3R5J1_PSECA|nr:hypothetical protein ALQ51_04389 [Pseudomonas cannabina]
MNITMPASLHFPARGTITSTIVRRSASDPDSAAPRRFVTQSVTQGIPTLERAERYPNYRVIVRRSASHAALDALRPILNRRRGADWRRRASPKAFRRWSVRNDNLNYRVIVRRSASHAALDALRPILNRRRGADW